jgi:hypothetical protein
MPHRLDLFFFYGSTYTYLTVMRVERAAARAGVEVRWRPFNVREIMLEQDNIPFRDKPVKMRYMWRDIERRAARYGIPFDRVPTYPVDPDSLANRVGVLAAVEGWCPEYTKATYRAWFLEDKPPEIPSTSTRSSRHWVKIQRPWSPWRTHKRFATDTTRKPAWRAVWESSVRPRSRSETRYSGATIASRTPSNGVNSAGRASESPCSQIDLMPVGTQARRHRA